MRIRNYKIDKPVYDIVLDIKSIIKNGKLSIVKVTSSGISVTCPVHSGGHESNNSCVVDPNKGIFNCFACNTSGTFAKFVAYCLDSSIESAENFLIHNYGTALESQVQIDDAIDLSKQFYKKSCLKDADLSAYQSYCDYFEKRHISRATAEKFSLKYDPVKRQVIFPVFNIKHEIIMLVKRSIDTKFFNMTEEVEKPVYCLDYVIKNNIEKAVICEGIFDCMTAYEYGYNAIATLGSVSSDQIKQINNSCIKVLYLCMDNDEKGRGFTDFIKKRLDKRILIKEVQFPAGVKDINDMTQEQFKKCIETSI